MIASLDILCSESFKLKIKVTRGNIGKYFEAHKRISKIFYYPLIYTFYYIYYISWPPQKPSSPLSYILNVRSLIQGEQFFRGKVFKGKILQKVRLRKLNKKQFPLINNDVFVAPDGVFEAFVVIPDDLTMDNDECIYSVKQSKIWLSKRILILLFYIVAFVCFFCFFLKD